MKNKYKIPWHIRQFVNKELLDYKANKKLLKSYKGDTRGLLIASTRLCQIEKVFKELNEEDKEINDEGSCDELEEIRAETKRIVSRWQEKDKTREYGKPPRPRICEVRRERNRQVERKTGERENETKNSSAAVSADVFRHLIRNDSEELVEKTQ